jgi:Phosphotransferase enzyme family
LESPWITAVSRTGVAEFRNQADEGLTWGAVRAPRTLAAMRSAAIVDDPMLPALRRLRTAGVASVLAPHRLHAIDGELRVLSHHPGSRCTILVPTAGGPVVLKAFPEDPVALVETVRALERVGLASGRGPSVPPLLAHDPELALTVSPLWTGVSMRHLIRAGDGARAGALAATWLRAAAAAPVRPGPAYGPQTVLAKADAWPTVLATVDPELGERAVDVIADLRAAPPEPGPPVLLHGSFGPRHVLALPDGPGVIDVDNLGHGPIEIDAGMMLAALERLGHARPHMRPSVDAAVSRLREDIAGLVDEDAVRWYRAGQLVRHARRAVAERTGAWEACARALLDDAGTVPAGA